MPTYLHVCESCNHEWEDNYSIHSDIPAVCPNCNVEGKVKRLIASNTPGKVELSNQELKQKVIADAQKYKQDYLKDENVRANFHGENKYNQIKTREDKYLKDMNGIFRRK